jgi:NADPH-dependent curcumin reductase CurA
VSEVQNPQIRLACRPSGEPDESTWHYVEVPAAAPGPDQVLVRNLYLSIDPAMRSWLNPVKTYVPPVGIDEVMRALGLGVVETSNSPKFAKGDLVSGVLGVQAYATVGAKHLESIGEPRLPLQTYLGALGMTGMTAYFGLLEVGQPKPGQTVLVSAAAGAVGSLVGQIAKIRGCRVVGIAGGADKCAYLVDTLGFDAAVDYKAEGWTKALKDACPDRVDVFFDNVGGEVLEAALLLGARGARYVICGMISQYNSARIAGPSNYATLILNRSRMEGFVVFDYHARYPEAVGQLTQWIQEGRIQNRDHVVAGQVRDFPAVLKKLFSGENHGKLSLQIGSV